tara:strand:- start:208 stop:387 length:180 start_codon:yes stop_codon:yes gene_type:complete
MRTTYRGQNRAQALKTHREMLEYQKLKAEGKIEDLKQKYFAEPTRFEKILTSVKKFFKF